MRYTYVQQGEDRYLVVREMPVTPKITRVLDLIKELWDCDTVLKRNQTYFFCKKLWEAQYSLLED